MKLPQTLACLVFCLFVFTTNAQEPVYRLVKRTSHITNRLPDETGVEQAKVIRMSKEDIALLKKTAHINWSIDGREWPLKLQQKDNGGANIMADGAKVKIPGPELLSGTLQNGKGSVRLAVNDNFVYGFIDDGETRLFIEPLKKFDKSAGHDEYILYEPRNVKMPENFCGGYDTIPFTANTKQLQTTNSVVKTTCIQVKLAVATDYSVYQHYNGDIETIANYVMGNWHISQSYFNSFDLDEETGTDMGDDEIHMPVVSIYIVTDKASDILPNNSFSMKAFAEWAPKHFAEPYDIIELVTNRRITVTASGNVGGVATFYQKFCSGQQVHIIRDYYQTGWAHSLVAAHEAGHNLGCGHDVPSLLGGKSFIMTPSGLTSNVTRFSRWTDHSDTSRHGSHWAIKEYYRFSAQCYNNPCAVYSCGRVTEPVIMRYDANTVRLQWKGTAQRYLVQYKVSDSASYSASNIFELTETEKTITGLLPCARYEFLIKAICDPVNSSPPVILGYQVSGFSLDSITVLNAVNGRYDLQFNLNFLNSNNQSLAVEAQVGFEKRIFQFQGTQQQIVLRGWKLDGQSLKKLLIRVPGYGDCYTYAIFRPPASSDCTPILSADFNNGSMPAGWTNNNTRATPISNMQLAIGLNDRTLMSWSEFPYGSIDSTRMAFFDYWNGGIQRQFGKYEIISPEIDITGKANTSLSFDYAYYRWPRRKDTSLSYLKVEVFDGNGWAKVFMIDSSRSYVNYTDSQFFWSSIPPRIKITLDKYRNTKFRLRFTLDDGTGPLFWQRGIEAAALDNILVCGADICSPLANDPITLQRGHVHMQGAAKYCTDQTYFSHYYTNGDSLLLSYQKTLHDTAEIYPGQVKLHYFTNVVASAAPMPTPSPVMILNKEWLIDPAIPFSDTTVMRLYFTRGELQAISTELGVGVSPDIIRPYYYQADSLVFPYARTGAHGQNYFAEFAWPAGGGVMGIGAGLNAQQVTNLRGIVYADKIRLHWNVTNDLETVRYIVERSNNGIDFTVIGTVTAAYQFDDNNPLAGRAFYRLRLMNRHDRYIFSNSIDLRWSQGGVMPILTYPNPTGGELQVELNVDEDGPVFFDIINTAGQIVHTERRSLQAGFNRFTARLKGLVAGVYSIRWRLNDKIHHSRFVKL
jgi:hypothetical protein